jgi:hypothetical protein
MTVRKTLLAVAFACAVATGGAAVDSPAGVAEAIFPKIPVGNKGFWICWGLCTELFFPVCCTVVLPG